MPFFNASSLALLLISLVVVGNTWQETRTAFRTFSLSTDQKNAYSWLKQQGKGDYRLASPPFVPWVYEPEAGYVIDPTYWTYLHGQKSVGGGVPALGVKYTGNTLESLNSSLEDGPFDIGEWLRVFNAKYLLIDKTKPFSSNIVIGDGLERVWASATIDIYENHSMLPRVFSFTETNERVVDLFTGNAVNLAYGEGTQEAMVSLSTQHHLHQELAVQSTYHFIAPGDYLCLEANVEHLTFGEDDAIRLTFYSERNLPDVHLSLGLYEQDDSRYDVILDSADGIKAGWNEASFPFSLLTLRYSVDENAQLDPDQIDRLSIGVGKQGSRDRPLSFELYFDQLSIVAQEVNTSLEYIRIEPGEYKVHFNSDSPSYLVLSESYHPKWVARTEDQTVHSEIIYGCLNAFHLEPGEYDVTLKFVTSPLRKAGSILSSVGFLSLCSLAVFVIVRASRRKKPGTTPTGADLPTSGA